jgi:hypothetical protein
LLRIRDQESKVAAATVGRVRATRERIETALGRHQQLEL